MTDPLTFNDKTLKILKGSKFDINWKDEEDESKIIITIPEIPKAEVEEWVTMIMRAAE